MIGAKVIEGILGKLGEGAGTVLNGVASIRRIKSIDKTQQENNIHGETVQMLKAFAVEMGKEDKNLWDSFISGINRLPRPIIAFITITLFLICLVSPQYAKDVAMAFYGLPNNLYWILGAVITFYFGGRALNDKFKSSRPQLSAEQHASLITAVQSTEKKILDSNSELIVEEKKTRETLLDENGDSIDDRFQKHLEDSEGWVEKMYKCPAGYWTIGFGINLEQQKIPKPVARLWTTLILKSVIAELKTKFPFLEKLEGPRFWVVVDMAYNLGIHNKFTFHNTVTALKEELDRKRPSYRKVVKAMKSGKWFKQVGTRSKKLVQIMETGEWV